jgi:hypothetical protein
MIIRNEVPNAINFFYLKHKYFSTIQYKKVLIVYISLSLFYYRIIIDK